MQGLESSAIRVDCTVLSYPDPTKKQKVDHFKGSELPIVCMTVALLKGLAAMIVQVFVKVTSFIRSQVYNSPMIVQVFVKVT
jgi:hypothetical protein